MYFCGRCGRKISAEEAVILSPPDGVGENLILCSSCSSRVKQNPVKNSPTSSFTGLFLMILAAIVIGLVWFALFYLTAYPWDFLAVLAGWAIARLLIRIKPVGRSSRDGLAAILLTGLAIFIREYLLLSLVVDYTTSVLPLQTGFTLLPLSEFGSALASDLSANPFTILIWMLSSWITYITTVGIRSKS
jgi:DNA-directed RNA polymerase subunit RPC12/RpoP